MGDKQSKPAAVLEESNDGELANSFATQTDEKDIQGGEQQSQVDQLLLSKFFSSASPTLNKSSGDEANQKIDSTADKMGEDKSVESENGEHANNDHAKESENEALSNLFRNMLQHANQESHSISDINKLRDADVVIDSSQASVKSESGDKITACEPKVDEIVINAVTATELDEKDTNNMMSHCTHESDYEVQYLVESAIEPNVPVLNEIVITNEDRKNTLTVHEHKSIRDDLTNPVERVQLTCDSNLITDRELKVLDEDGNLSKHDIQTETPISNKDDYDLYKFGNKLEDCNTLNANMHPQTRNNQEYPISENKDDTFQQDEVKLNLDNDKLSEPGTRELTQTNFNNNLLASDEFQISMSHNMSPECEQKIDEMISQPTANTEIEIMIEDEIPPMTVSQNETLISPKEMSYETEVKKEIRSIRENDEVQISSPLTKNNEMLSNRATQSEEFQKSETNIGKENKPDKTEQHKETQPKTDDALLSRFFKSFRSTVGSKPDSEKSRIESDGTQESIASSETIGSVSNYEIVTEQELTQVSQRQDDEDMAAYKKISANKSTNVTTESDNKHVEKGVEDDTYESDVREHTTSTQTSSLTEDKKHSEDSGPIISRFFKSFQTSMKPKQDKEMANDTMQAETTNNVIELQENTATFDSLVNGTRSFESHDIDVLPDETVSSKNATSSNRIDSNGKNNTTDRSRVAKISKTFSADNVAIAMPRDNSWKTSSSVKPSKGISKTKDTSRNDSHNVRLKSSSVKCDTVNPVYTKYENSTSATVPLTTGRISFTRDLTTVRGDSFKNETSLPQPLNPSKNRITSPQRYSIRTNQSLAKPTPNHTYCNVTHGVLKSSNNNIDMFNRPLHSTNSLSCITNTNGAFKESLRRDDNTTIKSKGSFSRVRSVSLEKNIHKNASKASEDRHHVEFKTPSVYRSEVRKSTSTEQADLKNETKRIKKPKKCIPKERPPWRY